MKALTQIIRLLDRFNRWVVAACKLLTILLVAAMTLNVFVGVFSRYALNHSMPWYEELGKFLMFWMTFAAAPIVFKARAFVALDMLPLSLPFRLRQANYVIVFALVLGLTVFLVWVGWSLAWLARGQQPSSISVSFFWIYAAIPAGSAAMAVSALEFLLRSVAALLGDERMAVDDSEALSLS